MGPKVTRAITLRPWEVSGLLAGEITQLRRVVKPQLETAIDGEPYWYIGGFRRRPESHNYIRCPYPPGTEIWGRETWRGASINHEIPRARFFTVQYKSYAVLPYRNDWADVFADLDRKTMWRAGQTGIAFGPWRSPATMPRSASRWSGIVESVRVERVGEITEEDAVKCGNGSRIGYVAQFETDYSRVGAKDPWVWVIDLKGGK